MYTYNKEHSTLWYSTRVTWQQSTVAIMTDDDKLLAQISLNLIDMLLALNMIILMSYDILELFYAHFF